jgi:hypothetical protein
LVINLLFGSEPTSNRTRLENTVGNRGPTKI